MKVAAADAIPRDYNFADDLFRRFRDQRWLDRVAYLDPRGRWTYRQLAERARQFASVLEEKDIQPGERVLMCMLDTVDWPSVFLGTIYAGRVAVPVNTLMTEDDYRFMLADSGARILVVSPQLLPKFEKLVTALPEFHLIVAGSDEELPHQDLEKLIADADPARSSRRRRPATASRSGSTPRDRPASRRRRCMCMPTSS